jgi:hypothetical protein
VHEVKLAEEQARGLYPFDGGIFQRSWRSFAHAWLGL